MQIFNCTKIILFVNFSLRLHRIPRVFHIHRNLWVFQVCGHPVKDVTFFQSVGAITAISFLTIPMFKVNTQNSSHPVQSQPPSWISNQLQLTANEKCTIETAKTRTNKKYQLTVLPVASPSLEQHSTVCQKFSISQVSQMQPQNFLLQIILANDCIFKPGIEGVRALADISCSALCCQQQQNPCTNCKAAQQCTTTGHPLPFSQVTSGTVQ